MKFGYGPTSALASAEVAKAYVATARARTGKLSSTRAIPQNSRRRGTCVVRDTTFLRSNAVTARTSSRSDVVTLSSCVRLDGTVARCANLPGRRISGLRDAWQGRSPHDRRAHTLDWGELAAKISDLRYGVTVWTLNSGKRTKTVETTDATRNARACARVMGSYW